jgi:FixJ family two-component response regulator
VPKAKPLISIIDDDESMREAIKGLMRSLGYRVEAVASAQEFLSSRHVRRTSCLIADMQNAGDDRARAASSPVGFRKAHCGGSGFLDSGIS